MSRRSRLLLASLIAIVVGGCGAAPQTSEDPAAAVRNLLERVDAGDVAGATATVCAAQREEIQQQLDPASGLGQMLPGIDPAALLGAVTFDTSGLTTTPGTVTGDTAEVGLDGTVRVTIDEDQLREVIGPVASGMGVEPSALEGILSALEATPIPVDEQVTVVREDGVWRVCDADFSFT
jgi:hypothetical protein